MQEQLFRSTNLVQMPLPCWLLTGRECSHQILHLTASETYTASTFEYIAASQHIHTLGKALLLE
jgi:hypothetical protein